MVGHFPLLLWARIRLVSWNWAATALWEREGAWGNSFFRGQTVYLWASARWCIFYLG